jgi:hydroxyacyl-ACP dehydratase HTD2-like protein with hotdog domain
MSLHEDALPGNLTDGTADILAHQIHYSQPWTRRIEGHPEIVVHAPLNLILMLELYRKTYQTAFPASIEYRAVGPLYAGEEYRINLAESGEVWCDREEDGGVCMTGRIASSAGKDE